MPIRQLPREVADKIAAGEIIERPASVAKELVENAIDAGAEEVRIQISQGGRRLIQVADNGCGIPADQVELAFARHATSKLTSAEDLYSIRTLGFRGEALASIGAVAHLALTTRSDDEQLGTLVRMEGGILGTPQATARPRGTTVRVENLFYNTPARLKFLRTDPTEAGHIARLTTCYALAHPHIRFSLQSNDRLVLRTNGTGNLFDVLVAVYGLDIAEQMLELQAPAAKNRPLRVRGYVSTPAVHRSNRSDIALFINRRWVQDSSLTYAVTEAYRTLLPQRRHPIVVLQIEMPPEDVDVNIHPTKREVRFRHAREVFVTVQRAVRTTLMAQSPITMVTDSSTSPSDWSRIDALRSLGRGERPSGQAALDLYRTADRPSSDGRPSGETDALAPATERLPMLRVVGQIAQTYIVAEGPGGMYLIDQHAAHERIRYEELRSSRENGSVPSQELLQPLMIEFSPEQATLLSAHLDDLSAFGFDLSEFGGTSYLVRRVPANLVGEDASTVLGEIVDRLLDRGERASLDEEALIILSCHTAIRAGQTLSHDEMRGLVRQLEHAEAPHTCPHGRPTILLMSRALLERQFGRT